MTFCTACASPLAPAVAACPNCGARRELGIAEPKSRSPGAPARRSLLIRLLYLAPVLLMFAVAGGYVQRHTEQQEWLRPMPRPTARPAPATSFRHAKALPPSPGIAMPLIAHVKWRFNSSR